MVHLLYKYLILHKQVAIPGVGMFHIERKPAQHDAEKKVFLSPVFNIDFTPGTAITDKEFFSFVSQEQGIDEVEAVKHLHDFAHRLKQSVSAHKRVELPGMGVLNGNDLGQFSFECTDVLTNYFPPIIEERIFKDHLPDDTLESPTKQPEYSMALHEETFASPERKDYWWLFAIILAAISIAAILYYYYENRSLM